MPLIDAILPEFDHEMANTRKVLERVPDDRLDWRPHPKSSTMGALATHVAMLPSWTVETFGRDELDLMPDGKPVEPQAPAKSREELLSRFDAAVAAARSTLTSGDGRRDVPELDAADERTKSADAAAGGGAAELRPQPLDPPPRAAGRVPPAQRHRRPRDLRPVGR